MEEIYLNIIFNTLKCSEEIKEIIRNSIKAQFDEFCKQKHIDYLDYIYICDDVIDYKKSIGLPTGNELACGGFIERDGIREWNVFIRTDHVFFISFDQFFEEDLCFIPKSCKGYLFHEFNHVYDLYVNDEFYKAVDTMKSDGLNVFVKMWKEYYAERETLEFEYADLEVTLENIKPALVDDLSIRNEENIAKCKRFFEELARFIVIYQTKEDRTLDELLGKESNEIWREIIDKLACHYDDLYKNYGKWCIEDELKRASLHFDQFEVNNRCASTIT